MKINKKVISLQAKNPRILGMPNKKETNEKYFGLVKMLQQCRHEEAEDNLNEENLIDTPEPNPLLQIAVEIFTTMVEKNLSEASLLFTTMVEENLSEASLLFTAMVEENLSEASLLFTAMVEENLSEASLLFTAITIPVAVEIVVFLLDEKQADTLFLMPVTALVNILVEMVLQGRQKEAANILVAWKQKGGPIAQKTVQILIDMVQQRRLEEAEDNLSEENLRDTPVKTEPNPLLPIAVEIVIFLLYEKQLDILFFMPVTELVTILVALGQQGKQKEVENILTMMKQKGGPIAQNADTIRGYLYYDDYSVKPPRQTNIIVEQEEPSSTSRMLNRERINRLVKYFLL
jgi:hypothetical protein